MPKEHEYACTGCGRQVGKLNLLTKRVEFREVGKGGASIKSRTVGWFCIIPQDDGSPSCVDSDPDWHRPIYGTSPGMTNTVLEEEVVQDDEVPALPVDDVLGLDEHLRKVGLR